MAAPIRASDVKSRAIKWLWRERVPEGMMTIIAGRPDQGKGLVAVHIGAEVSNMGKNVLHSAIEDGHDTMTKPRYEAAGADMDRVYLYRFLLPAMLSELEHYVIEKNIDLIVMDPFAAHLSGVSRHSDNIRNLLNPLTEMLEATNTSLIVVEHALKRVPANGHALNAIGGSGSGLPAAARMAYVFGVDPNDDDRRMLCAVKSNLRESPQAMAFNVDVAETDNVGEVPLLLFDSECEFNAIRLFENPNKSGGKVGRPPDKRAAAAEWLTNYLSAAGKTKAGKIFEDAKHYGMTAKTLRRAAVDMEIVKDPVGGGRNCTWDLSDETKDLLDSGGTPDENDENPTKVPDAGSKDELSDTDIAKLLGGGPSA